VKETKLLKPLSTAFCRTREVTPRHSDLYLAGPSVTAMIQSYLVYDGLVTWLKEIPPAVLDRVNYVRVWLKDTQNQDMK